MTIKQITRFINILIYNNIIIVKHANMNVIKSQKKTLSNFTRTVDSSMKNLSKRTYLFARHVMEIMNHWSTSTWPQKSTNGKIREAIRRLIYQSSNIQITKEMWNLI